MAASIVATSRAVARRLIGFGRRLLKVVLVGPASEVVEVARMLREGGGTTHTLEVAAALRTDSGIGGDRNLDPSLRWLGGMRDLARIAREGGIDQVVLVPAEPRRDDPLDRVLQDLLLDHRPLDHANLHRRNLTSPEPPRRPQLRRPRDGANGRLVSSKFRRVTFDTRRGYQSELT